MRNLLYRFLMVIFLSGCGPGFQFGDTYVATILKLASGNGASCILNANNELKCWGRNGTGQAGVGTSEDIGDDPGEMGTSVVAADLGTTSPIQHIALKQFSVCVLFDTGKVKCFGANHWGQLGRDNNSGQNLLIGDEPGEMGESLPFVDLGSGRTVKKLTAGIYHYCAILDNDVLKCWGDNRFGALGLGDTNGRGDSPGEMGDALPAVDLGTGLYAVDVHGGNNFTCALLNTGSIKCWGINTDGELGLGDTTTRGNTGGQMGDNLPTVDLGTSSSIRQVAVGNGHTCVLFADQTVKCWGVNSSGQLGLNDSVNRGSGAGQMGTNLPTLNFGTSSQIINIASGGGFSCATFADGTVKCWGFNGFGALGLGDTTNRADASTRTLAGIPFSTFGAGNSVLSMQLGVHDICALLKSGTTNRIKCWGYNELGVLGTGDTVSKGIQTDETMALLPYLDLTP